MINETELKKAGYVREGRRFVKCMKGGKIVFQKENFFGSFWRVQFVRQEFLLKKEGNRYYPDIVSEIEDFLSKEIWRKK